jgi:hypothetical protein
MVNPRNTKNGLADKKKRPGRMFQGQKDNPARVYYRSPHGEETLKISKRMNDDPNYRKLMHEQRADPTNRPILARLTDYIEARMRIPERFFYKIEKKEKSDRKKGGNKIKPHPSVKVGGLSFRKKRDFSAQNKPRRRDQTIQEQKKVTALQEIQAKKTRTPYGPITKKGTMKKKPLHRKLSVTSAIKSDSLTTGSLRPTQSFYKGIRNDRQQIIAEAIVASRNAPSKDIVDLLTSRGMVVIPSNVTRVRRTLNRMYLQQFPDP